MNKSIVTNAALNVIKTVLGILFPILTYPYVTRILGVENMGIYNFSYSFISYFQLVAALGIATYGIREGVAYRDNKKQMNLFVSEVFTINMISTIISYSLLFLLLFVVPQLLIYKTTILILSAEIFFTTFGVSWICNVYEDFLAIAIRTILFQILSLILIFIFVKTNTDLNHYALILLLSNSGANLINFFYIRKKYCKFKITAQIDWKRHIRPILVIFSTNIAITVYVSSDITMLGLMTGNYQVGLYGTAVKIYTIIKNILVSILVILIPRFSLMLSKGKKEETNLLFSQVFGILTVLMVPMCVGLFCISEDVVLLISGQEYLQAAIPLKILTIAVVCSLYAYMFVQCILIPLREEKIVFQATVISAIINIALNLFLIPFYGMNATAFTTVVAEFATFAIVYYHCKDKVKLVKNKRILTQTLLGSVGIIIVCMISKRIDMLMMRVLISIITSVLVYFAVLILFHHRYVVNFLKKFP